MEDLVFTGKFRRRGAAMNVLDLFLCKYTSLRAWLGLLQFQTPAGTGLPSAPAGGPAATAVDADRRRGRGAQSNASGRFEPVAPVASTTAGKTEDLPPFKTTVTIDATRKIITRKIARHFLRPLDNPYRAASTAASTATRARRLLGLSPGLDFNRSCS
jgi:hypothetical protein